MYRRPPRSSRTYTLLPSTTLFRSVPSLLQHPGTVACYCVLCATGVDGPGKHAHPRRGYLGEPAMDARQFCAFGHPYFGGYDPDRPGDAPYLSDTDAGIGKYGGGFVRWHDLNGGPIYAS